MSATKYPLFIEQGATFDKSLTYSTGTQKNAVPVDLTGCTARAQIRSDIDSETVLLELTTENGRIVLGGVTGEIRIVIDAVTTAGITWESGVYDLELVFANGFVKRLIAGSVSVSKEVTRV